MKSFSRLFAELDTSTSTHAKVEAMARYFAGTPPQDAAWAVYFLAGGKPRQVVNSRALREFAVAASGLPQWLFDESYEAVGDLAETIAHLLPPPSRSSALGLAEWITERLLPLRALPPAEALDALRRYADELDAAERFLLIKLIGGGFRVGVSRLLVTRALAQAGGIDAKRVAQRLIGFTNILRVPDAAAFTLLLAPESAEPAARGGTPYPFFLAYQLSAPPESLGAIGDWLVEWKYDGIRAQLVRRGGETWLWSRGEELISERFPEVISASQALPDGSVLDGELLVWDAGAEHPAPFARLQTRTTRKTLSAKLLRDTPVSFVAYDLLEREGADLRGEPQRARRAALESLIEALSLDATRPQLRLSPRVSAADWTQAAQLRATSRARSVEGFMLKRLDAEYGVGRTKDVSAVSSGDAARRERAAGLPAGGGAWIKWKIDPMSVDCVLVYAQRGHGRRASLYTDYTFAVWDRAPTDAVEAQQVVVAIVAGETPESAAARGLPRLVPFAKAYSGLTDEEIRQVDAVIRKTTREKFGPVRSVLPSLVFELGFEGIQKSPRHKSGIAVRFPRMLHWRADKPLHEADTLAALDALLALPGIGQPSVAASSDDSIEQAGSDPTAAAMPGSG